MRVLDARGDFFIGLWIGKIREKEFFAPYGMRSIISLE